MNHFIGIDNSSLDHKVHIMNGDDNSFVSFTIENTLKGFMQFHDSIKHLENPRIGFELPHGPFVDFLRDKGYVAYSLNPLKIKRFKETMTVSGNKSDIIDAAAIAEYLKRNVSQCRPLLFNSSEIEKLKMLSIIHTRMTEEHARYKNKLRYALRQYFCLQESLFTNCGCTVQLEMIRKYPTFGKLKQASDEELAAFLKTNKYCVPKRISNVIEKIRTYDQIIAPEVEFAYSLEMTMLCDVLRTLKREMKAIENEMKRILKVHCFGEVFRSLPGAGTVLAAKLLALFGDNTDRFDYANQAQCLFGTAPKNYQSGNYHKVLMRRACNKSARAVLFVFAFASLRCSGWAREYYDGQRKKGKTHSVAIRALSNKWVQVIFRMWKNQEIYLEGKKISPAA